MPSNDELRKYDEIIKNCEDAIENCEDAIKINPDDRKALLAQLYAHRKAQCKALCDKGILYGRSGRSGEAYKAEQIQLGSIIYYLESDLGIPYKMKSFDDLLEKSDDIQKKNLKILLSYIWTVKGFELSNHGKSEEAIKSYDKAIELYPAVIAWVAKGYELSKLGKSIEAIEAYNNMLYHIFDEPTALFNLSVEYSKIDSCKAIETYEICIDDDIFLCKSCFNKGIEIGKCENIREVTNQLGLSDSFDVTNSIKCGNIKEITNRRYELIKQLPNGTLIKFRHKQSEYFTQVNASDYEYPTLNSIFTTRGISVNIWAHIYARYRDENGHWLPLDNLRTHQNRFSI